MITVTYKLYNCDYDKKIEKRTFYSMKEVEDWLFEKMTGNLKDAAYFMDPDDDRFRYNPDGSLRLCDSGISVKRNGNRYETWIQMIEKDGKIIYSTGAHTNGICHWNEEVKQWIRGLREKQLHPQYNFG